MANVKNRSGREIKGAVVREKGGPFKIEALTLEGPRRDQVLVKIVATGMCHIDMVAHDKVYDVPHPIVLGHEGLVEETLYFDNLSVMKQLGLV